MNGGPGAEGSRCPHCTELNFAIVPKKTELVDDEEIADGKVWVNCHGCGERYLEYYRYKGTT